MSGEFLAHVIGLEDGYRGLPLESDLNARGFRVNRVPGVLVSERDMQGESQVYDAAGAKIAMRRELTRGEVGCALAHRDAARAVLAEGSRAGFICEDDARLRGNWSASDLPWEALGEKPAIVQLYSHGSRTIVSRKSQLAVLDGRTLWRARLAPLTTTTYMINRSAAELLATRQPVRHVADWPLRLAARTRFSVIYPWPAIVADEPSTLEAGRRETGPIDGGKGNSKLLRHLRALTHVTWLQDTEAYDRDYRAYATHEIWRLLLGKATRLWGASASPGHIDSPMALWR